MRAHGAERWIAFLWAALALYLITAYVFVPWGWEAFERAYPSFDDNPRITQTSDGHPGDPLNVALIGTRAEIAAVMQQSGWYPAAPLGLTSDLKIAADTVLSRPDQEAPVSNLYLFGRKEDLAFEKPVGQSPRERHHVRFWQTKHANDDGRPIWIGSASFDKGIGISHTTGQITHHIAADVDAERDYLMNDLEHTGRLANVFAVSGFHSTREGHNGGGDPWHTDGALSVGEISK